MSRMKLAIVGAGNVGDDPAAKATVARLAVELGFEAVDVRPLKASRWLEPLGMLWIQLALAQGPGPTGHAFKLLRRQRHRCI
jgi:8-hydroxy-5-deazaflavin:NADPH oxidoreductase